MSSPQGDQGQPKPVWEPKRAARDAFLSMPEDVFHTICEHLDFPDILRLVCTNSHFAGFERGLLLHNDLVRKTNRVLCWACRRGDLALAEKCLKMGCNPNYYPNAWRGEKLFWLPIWNGSRELEIEHPSELYSIDSPPQLLIIFSIIAQAIMQDRTNVLSLLHRYGAEIQSMPLEVIYADRTPYCGSRDYVGSEMLSPLHLARSPEMIKMIISLVPDILVDETEEANGDSILSWLIYRDMDSQGIQYLLEAGAHPDCKGPYSLLGDMTPLETALVLMNPATVKVLLEWGASLVNESANGASGAKRSVGLYYALTASLFQTNSSMEASQEIMSLLIHHGVDIGCECQSESLQSPDLSSNLERSAEKLNLFRYVLEYGTSDFLRFLVNAGADPYMLMPQGNTSIRRQNSRSDSSALQATQWILKQIDNIQKTDRWNSVSYPDEDDRKLLEKLKVLLETHPKLLTRAALYTFAIRNMEMKFLEEVLRVINLTRSDFRCPWGPGALARLLHRGSILGGHLGHLHDCVLLLLRTGANVNNCHKGKTALHRAFSLPIASPQDSDDMDVEDATVDWDSDWDDWGFYERPIYPDFSTEEHAALRQDNVLSIILSLLLNGAGPKAEDDEKKTPAWYAKTNGWLDLDSPKAVAIRDMVERAPVYPWREREDHATCYEITGEWD